MAAHDPGQYGRSFADVYDDWYADVSDIDATIAGIAARAPGGPVLELGSGTGRLAGPLRRAGVPVIALDASPEMNQRFAAKGAADPIVEADMTRLPLGSRTVDLVFVAFNTICNLVAPGAQRRCVQEAARILRPGGWFVVEVLVPPDPDLTPSQATSLQGEYDGTVVLASTRRGDDLDHVIGRHIEIGPDRSRTVRSWELRWITPGRLDELSAAAGLVLQGRDADWRGTPFDDAADTHVSWYRAVS